jgi:LacI family transcriptional regulator
MAKRASTVRDVAKKAGVSITTVSRVINKGGGISGATVERVEKAMRDLNYVRNRAVATRANARALIGLVIPDVALTDPHFIEILRGLYDTCDTYDAGLYMKIYAGYQDTGEGFRDELGAAGATGVVLVPSPSTRADALGSPADWPPLVVVERTLEGFDASSVVVDNREGAYQATRYLLKLGHTGFAWLGGQEELSTERERFAGFRQALAEAGLACPAGNVLRGRFELAAARAAVEERLKLPRDFTAVLAASDVMAFGAKEALDRAGLAVPRSVSLVGFDDIPFSSALGLTTVAQPSYLIGRNALVMLMALVAGRVTAPRHDQLLPGLSIRTTCGAVEQPGA